MKRIERNYLIALLVTTIVLLVATVVSFIAALVIMVQTDTATNNILEMIYMGVHFIAVFLAFTFTLKAIRTNKGSMIMKELMVVSNTSVASVRARIVAIILATFGFVGGMYFTLVLCGVPLPYFNFPIALLLDLVNSPFTVFLIGLFFIFYPTIYHKSLKEGA